MAVITTYAELLTEVANTLARDDLTNDIPLFVQAAENKLFRNIDLRQEETVLAVTVTNGVGRVPARFKKLKVAWVNEAPATLLQWIPIEDLIRKYPDRSEASTPSFISRLGSDFTFGPNAKDFSMLGIYWRKSTASRTAIATDTTGDTDGSTATITGMTDTSDFEVGDSVTVSAGFPSATEGYKILSKTATAITLDASSTSAETNVTVTALANYYITDAPEVLLYGALLEAVPFIKDDSRIAVWQMYYDMGVQSLIDENMDSDYPTGSLVQRTEVVAI